MRRERLATPPWVVVVLTVEVSYRHLVRISASPEHARPSIMSHDADDTSADAFWYYRPRCNPHLGRENFSRVGGVQRHVVCADAVVWLQSQPALPERCHVCTSLPDIGEMRPKLSAEAYERWFIDVVASILSRCAPHSVANHT